MVALGENIGELPDLKKEGFVFLGWYADSELKQPFYMKKMPSYNITIHAKWRNLENEKSAFAWLVTLLCFVVSVAASLVVFFKERIDWYEYLTKKKYWLNVLGFKTKHKIGS